MASIEVRYFAALREAAGVSEETLGTSATTVGELYDELAAKYKFKLEKPQVKASLNGNWVGLDANLNNNDRVVFIPPVAGG